MLEQKAAVLSVTIEKVTKEKLEAKKNLFEADQELSKEKQLHFILHQERDKENEETLKKRVENKKVIKQLESEVRNT